MYSDSTDCKDLTLKVLESCTNTVSLLPAAFTSKGDLQEYLNNLAGKKLDKIAQDLAKEIV